MKALRVELFLFNSLGFIMSKYSLLSREDSAKVRPRHCGLRMETKNFSFFLQNTNCHLISHYTFRCGTVHCPKSTPNQCLFLILTNGLMFCL